MRIDSRRRHPALGLGVALATLFLCYLAFFFGQTRCDAENNPHQPATCTLSGQQSTVLVPIAAYLSLAIFLLSLTALPPKVLIGLAVLVAALYVGWSLSVWVT